MKSNCNLSLIDNETLLRRLTELIGHDQQHEAQILEHIAEVDSRKLYAELAYPSMFAYCLGELHLSEAETFRRITAARMAHRFPLLLEKVASGDLHLCAIKLLAPHLNTGNLEQLVELATRTSKRTLETRLAALFPKQPVMDSVRKLPERHEPIARSLPAAQNEAVSELDLAGTTNPTARPALVPRAAAAQDRPRDIIDALATDRYKIQFTANEALRSKIDRAKELLPGSANDLASVFDRALDLLVDDLERKRFGSKKRSAAAKKRSPPVPGPATNNGATRNDSRSRYIPRSVRKAVDTRDGGQCTFARADGKRCDARRGLEFHHVQPFARGGPSTVENVTLRCKTHNLHAAELDFGSRTIDRFRCREPGVRYEIGPWRVPQYTDRAESAIGCRSVSGPPSFSS